ncbi:MAG TPA: hypothetical protein VFU15_16205 [Bacteroidia bacterium]|nr:hypothetical protein [Bacteroidia bacterium]
MKNRTLLFLVLIIFCREGPENAGFIPNVSHRCQAMRMEKGPERLLQPFERVRATGIKMAAGKYPGYLYPAIHGKTSGGILNP